MEDSDLFWKTKFSAPNSTFGTGPKTDVFHFSPKRKDLTRKILTHRPLSASGKTQGRCQLDATLDSLVSPDSDILNPNPFDISTKKRTPQYSMTFRHEDRKPEKRPGPEAYTLKSAFEKTAPYVEIMERQSSRDGAVVRNRHIGPGTYEVEIKGSKYERELDPILKPRDSTHPRKTISYSNLEVFERYQVDPMDEVDGTKSRGPCYYDVGEDPRKISLKKTFGERTPVLGLKVPIKPGPGDYHPDRADPLGGPSWIGSPSSIISRLKPLINPSADPDDMTSKLNKKVWVRHKSDYSFPKKVIPRLKKGQVFKSTVQDMPQYHAGKHSSGAFIKT